MNKIFFLLTAFILQFSTKQMNAQGNDCESAIICEMNGTPVAGVMIPPANWWYTFTLNADYSNVEISTCNSTINMSDVYLYGDCSEPFIATGDDCNPGNSNYNENITLTELTAGTYYVEVVGDFGYPSGGFTLSITGETSALNNDIGITHISKAVKNFNNDMPVTVTIENFGINTQTNFPVSYTFMGNIVTETYTGTIPPGESAQYTFLQTIDLATENTYSITAKTELVGDENPVNDEFSTKINTYVNPNALFFIDDDYAALPDNPAFDFTDDFTIEAWFYPHSTKMVGKLVSKHGNDGTNRSGYSIEYDGSNIKAVIGIGPNWMVVSEEAPPDQWHHVAMVYRRNAPGQVFTDIEFIVPNSLNLMNPALNQSHEPFFFDGQLYTTFQVNEDGGNFVNTTLNEPGEIWITTIDSSQQTMWLISDFESTLNVSEPESYTGNNKIFVYYSANTINPNNSPLNRIFQLRRCETPVNNALTSVDEQVKDIITVYPNPSGDIINVDLEGSFEYSIFNISGSLLKKGVANNQIDIYSLSSGTYILLIENGGLRLVKKIIKK